MTTAISTKWTCPLADCAWKTAGSLRRRRWRTGNESVSVASRRDAAPDHATQMAAVYRALSADGGGLLDGRDTGGDRALPPHGGNGSQRPGRCPVETLWRRHRARPA